MLELLIVHKYQTFLGFNLAKILNCKLQCVYLSTPRSFKLLIVSIKFE